MNTIVKICWVIGTSGAGRTHTHFVYYESHKMHKDQLQTRTTTFYEQFLLQFDARAFSVKFGNKCQNVVVGCLTISKKNTHKERCSHEKLHNLCRALKNEIIKSFYGNFILGWILWQFYNRRWILLFFIVLRVQ